MSYLLALREVNLMDVSAPTVLGQNITLVYQTLDLKAFESSKLKEFLYSPTVVMDTPDMIVAFHPPIPLIIQVGDRRVRITAQRQSTEIGEPALWEIAHKCHGLVAQAQLVAYGFNYDVQVMTTGANLNRFMLDTFVCAPEVTESLLGGTLSSVIPRLKFERDAALYDLILEPLDEQRLKAHLNVHLKTVSLPPQDQLETAFRAGFAYLSEVLPTLLGKAGLQ